MSKALITAAEKAETLAYLQWEHNNMHFVEQMEHVAPYTLRLTFDDGTKKEINFRDFVFHSQAGPQYNKLQDLDYFNQVVLLDGHLTWLFENDNAPFPRGWNFNPAMLYTWEGDSWKQWLVQE